MDTRSAMFAHLEANLDAMFQGESERRRPGITALCNSVRDAHPDWPEIKVAVEAKAQWERSRAGVAPNPKVPV